MPEGLAALAEDALREGVRNVSMLISRWVDGSETYQLPGENLLVAIDPTDASVVGVGGLSVCPDVPGALRVRRFYVAHDWRRRGVARALAEQIMADGARSTELLTCNAAASDAARPFWESMGFVPSTVAGITHEKLC